MKKILMTVAATVAVISIAAPAHAANTINGGGATFPYPLISSCAADFNAVQSNFTIQYTPTGSGTGKSNFTKQQFVFAQTDSKYNGGEPSFSWQYVPNIGGAIVFPINLKNEKTGRTLGSSIQLKQVTLAKILAGKISVWNDKEIIHDNPALANILPATPITVVYRSDASGTTNNLLQYLNAWAPTIWSKVQDDMGTAFPGGKPLSTSLASKGNAAVIATINNTPGAIGYVDISDAKGYPVARIQNASGQFVSPSPATAAKNLANQTNVAANGLVTLDYNSNIAGAYPIVIFSYMLVRTDGKGPNGLGVRQFADYILQKCAPAKAPSLGYVPVGGKVLQTAKTFINNIK